MENKLIIEGELYHGEGIKVDSSLAPEEISLLRNAGFTYINEDGESGVFVCSKNKNLFIGWAVNRGFLPMIVSGGEVLHESYGRIFDLCFLSNWIFEKTQIRFNFK